MGGKKKQRKEAQKSGTREDKYENGPEAFPRPGVTSLVATAPPSALITDLPPEQLEFYVRAAIHQDRNPGNLLIVRHPGRTYKFPSDIPLALEKAGFKVSQVDTEADRISSVEKIRDALQKLSRAQVPLDLLVVSGDGTLDHHVLVAAYWAFHPELVRYRPGVIDCSAVGTEDLEQIHPVYRSVFFKKMPDGSALEPSEETIKAIWLLRSRLESGLRKQKPLSKILRTAHREPHDLLLRIAVLATFFPEKVVLRPHGFDLSGLANASQEKTFQGLYPFIRCISIFPAGTAADNAVFAGVPGLGYGFWAGLLNRFRILAPLKRLFSRRASRRFLHYFMHDSVVVPARVSVVGFDGDWQRISSHAAGGPGSGHFFSADLTAKTRGLLGYLKRIPRVIIQEGVFGSTIVRIRSRFASGTEKSFTEAQMAEGLYSNRTFLAGIGSLPTTNPTSFAGQSSLNVLPPVLSRNKHGYPIVNIRGIGVFFEAISKGILARALHFLGLGVGTLAGGGKFSFLLAQHQVAIKEGESIEIDYLTMEKQLRAVAIQVSGDPFQACRLMIRTAWGPIPLLGHRKSLLLAAIRRSLADLRIQQSYRLGRVFIGGVRFFHHHIGEKWTPEFMATTGLLLPANHLPKNLPLIQSMLLEAWQKTGAGRFVDTTKSGLTLWRSGRYAHNNDQSAHLFVLKEPKGTLMVRQVRAMGENKEEIYETRSRYHTISGSYIIYHSQTVSWHGDEHPRILQEDHFFRSTETFQQEAPSFFPVMVPLPEEGTMLPPEIEELDPEAGEKRNNH